MRPFERKHILKQRLFPGNSRCFNLPVTSTRKFSVAIRYLCPRLMGRKVVSLLILLLALLAASSLKAQIGPINDSLVVGSPNVNEKDTVKARPQNDSSVLITNAPVKKDTAFHKHSPKKATLLSTFLPGAGQFYNKKYWKMPVIYVAGGAAIYGIVFYSKEYNNFRQAYKDRLATGFNDDPYYNQFQTPTLQSYRDYYRYYRDLSYIALGAVYVLQIVDAAVDAHFFDFKITDDLSLNVQPLMNFHSPVANTQLLFTLKF